MTTVSRPWSDLFSVKQLIARARELAAAHPGNRYKGFLDPDEDSPRCYYSLGRCDDGSYGCLFGQALLSLGVPEKQLKEEDADDPRTITAMLASRGFGLREQDDYLWLVEAQARQDAGYSWGECVKHADKRVRERQGRNPTLPSTQEQNMSDAAPRKITTHEPETGPHRLSIFAMDEPGPGGANHRYAIRATDPPPRDPESAAIPALPLVDHDIRFQQGPIGEVGVTGVTNESLLAVVADRLEGFQRGKFACHENQQALSHVREAIAWLEKRTLERMRRGVEGTHEL